MLTLKTSTVPQRFLSIYKTMLSYCLKWTKRRKNPKAVNTNKGRIMVLLKRVVYNSKPKFIKKQVAEGLLSVGKILVLGKILI